MVKKNPKTQLKWFRSPLCVLSQHFTSCVVSFLQANCLQTENIFSLCVVLVDSIVLQLFQVGGFPKPCERVLSLQYVYCMTEFDPLLTPPLFACCVSLVHRADEGLHLGMTSR